MRVCHSATPACARRKGSTAGGGQQPDCLVRSYPMESRCLGSCTSKLARCKFAANVRRAQSRRCLRRALVLGCEGNRARPNRWQSQAKPPDSDEVPVRHHEVENQGQNDDQDANGPEYPEAHCPSSGLEFLLFLGCLEVLRRGLLVCGQVVELVSHSATILTRRRWRALRPSGREPSAVG